MKLTNHYNLPAPLVSAIKNDPYEKVGDISISGLVTPPQLRALRTRHDDEVTEDAADNIWRLLGQSVHSVLDRADTTHHFAEERLTAKILGWNVTGKFDLFHPESGKLSDYKVTSVYSFLLGEKPEWEMQLNFYRWLLSQHGFEAKELEIVAVLRDWSRTKAKTDPDYPQVAVMVQPIPLWSIEKAREQIERLVRLHQNADALPDNRLPVCTPEQRWEKPTTYAVKKEGNKRAYRVFETEHEAETLAKENQMIVETRQGESTRCEDYCPVKQWCAQYAQSKKMEHAA